MWRTDYLVEGELKGRNSIKICEINARIPFNGVWLIGSHGEAYKKDILPNGLGAFSIPDNFAVRISSSYSSTYRWEGEVAILGWRHLSLFQTTTYTYK
jgi:hypothetical protein